MADSIKIKNIYYMLSYAYQTLRETGYDSIAEEDFDNIHDLFAAILVRGVGNQNKKRTSQGLYLAGRGAVRFARANTRS
jgi:5-methylcytosine-specific restriction enzyme subunit McrC